MRKRGKEREESVGERASKSYKERLGERLERKGRERETK